MRRFTFLLAAIVMLLGFSSPAVYAHSNRTQNTIMQGLNEGVRAATGESQPRQTTINNTGGTPAPATAAPRVESNGGVRTPDNTQTYAALGDSVAAGLGLSGTPSGTNDSRCGRSTQAYPYIVAQRLNLQLIHAACSGATAGDLVTRQGVSGPNIQAQLDTAFANGTPDLITITAGANDVHWVQFLRSCYTTNCATGTATSIANAYMTVLSTKLHYAFSQIQARSNGNPPKVIVTGYYNPVSQACKNRQNYITNNEIDFLDRERDQLNRTIRSAASDYNYTYVSADFTSHGLCSNTPWAQDLSDPAPLHPNTAGQQQIAEAVLRAAS